MPDGTKWTKGAKSSPRRWYALVVPVFARPVPGLASLWCTAPALRKHPASPPVGPVASAAAGLFRALTTP